MTTALLLTLLWALAATALLLVKCLPQPETRARLAETSDTDPREPPSADGLSIPRSVGPDADPLGECARCGQPSRRAYRKGLCPDCIDEAESQV